MHERTISLKFLGIILRVLRLEVSVYSTMLFILKTSFKSILLKGGGGGALEEVTVNSKEEKS